jgi:hypothetical protein
MKSKFVSAILLGVLVLLVGGLAFGQKGQNGATLAGYKTLDICVQTPATDTARAVWKYSGVISVWNSGAVDTLDFQIADFIEWKLSGPKWTKAFDVTVPLGSVTVIPAGTLQETALTFPYSALGDPLVGDIRNNASLTIMNHSGSLGTRSGPNPKATYTGPMPPPACDQGMGGCTYTQGYWGNKPGVVWPTTFSRDAMFFSSGLTWQQVMDTPVNVSQGYYQLAHQYIAAVLNQENGAYVPQGVQDTLNLAFNWLSSNAPSACTANGSCGLQKDWAAVLDEYNNGQ